MGGLYWMQLGLILKPTCPVEWLNQLGLVLGRIHKLDPQPDLF